MSPVDTTFRSGDLTISVTTAEDGATTVAWQGTSDAREPGIELSPFLAKVAEGLAGRSAIIDFRKLEYMNSATVSPIILFARTLNTLGVKTKLLFDASVGWQRVNFVAMKSIAKTLPHVEVSG